MFYTNSLREKFAARKKGRGIKKFEVLLTTCYIFGNIVGGEKFDCLT